MAVSSFSGQRAVVARLTARRRLKVGGEAGVTVARPPAPRVEVAVLVAARAVTPDRVVEVVGVAVYVSVSLGARRRSKRGVVVPFVEGRAKPKTLGYKAVRLLSRLLTAVYKVILADARFVVLDVGADIRPPFCPF